MQLLSPGPKEKEAMAEHSFSLMSLREVLLSVAILVLTSVFCAYEYPFTWLIGPETKEMS